MTTASEGIDEKNGCEIPNRIFVGGIAFSTTELELKTYFQMFGAVRDSKIITDRKGVSKGYGFITFECQEDASRVQEQGTVYFREKKLNIGPAIRKQPGGQFHKATSTTPKRSVDRSSDGDSLESAQSSAASSPQSQSSAEVASVNHVNHVDMSQFSHETVTAPVSTCPAAIVYAAPSVPTHCSAPPPGFVPVATTPANAWYYQHGEPSNSLQLVYYPTPTQHFYQAPFPMQSQWRSPPVNYVPTNNGGSTYYYGSALVSPTAHAAAADHQRLVYPTPIYIEPLDNPDVHFDPTTIDDTTAGPRVEIVGTPPPQTSTTNLTGSGRRSSIPPRRRSAKAAARVKTASAVAARDAEYESESKAAGGASAASVPPPAAAAPGAK